MADRSDRTTRPPALFRGTGVGRVTSLPAPVPYRWREAEQQRDAEVAARLAAVRARLAAKAGAP